MIWGLLLLGLLGWLAAVAYFYLRQNQVVYDPDKRAPDMARASVYPGEVVTLRPDDQDPAPDQDQDQDQDPEFETTSWYWPAQEIDGKVRGTILFFHGNNGNMETRTGWMQFALAQGWGMMMVGYRGYGDNPGNPDQRGLTADGLCAFDYLVHERLVPADQIYIFGHSLGSGVATQVAARRPCRALGLMSPFTAMHHVGFDRYPFLPTGLILRDQWRSIDKIAAIDCPLMIAYCDQDTTVRAKRSLQLFAAAQEPKEIVNLPGLDHGDIALSGGPKALVDFFARNA